MELTTSNLYTYKQGLYQLLGKFSHKYPVKLQVNLLRYEKLYHALAIADLLNLSPLNRESSKLSVYNVAVGDNNTIDFDVSDSLDYQCVVFNHESLRQTLIMYKERGGYELNILRFDTSQDIEDMDIELNIINSNIYENNIIRIDYLPDSLGYSLLNK